MYTVINYVLMCVSVLVIGGLVGGVIFLYCRELGERDTGRYGTQ